MRSIPLLAATSVILMGAWACGSDSGVGPNTPVANFTFAACTAGAPCTFTNTSTPASGLTYEWDFGDGSAKVSDQSPAHTFAASGDKTVSLKVTNASGATNTKISTVPVAAGTNTPPVASFDLPASCTAGTPCGFHTTSTDADGTIASSHWDFSDGGSANGPDATHLDATHTFVSAGPYNVTLTVTDNGGATSAPVSKPLTVSAQAAQGCTTSGKIVNCNITITGSKAVTLKFVMVSHDCQFSGNKLTANTPALGQTFQTVFFNLCNRSVNPPDEYTIKDAAGQDLVLQPGTPVTIRFSAGSPGPNDPPAGDAGVKITGNQQVNWTLSIDDGGLVGVTGEPDFNDAVVSVVATPQ
jgi:PKD repeat protein